jgi:hypothetical protein
VPDDTKPHIKHGTTPMKFTTKACLVLAGCALTSVGIAAAPAHANDWDYAIDSFEDGYTLGTIGAESAFEFYGMAIKSTADKVFVALNSNLARAGYDYSGANDGHIGYGDLFLNFSGKNRAQAEADGDLIGIRFATNSDSGAPELGVYSGVTSKDETKANSGFSSIKSHRDKVTNKGGKADFADLDSYGSDEPGGRYTNYFGLTTATQSFATSIASGTKIGDVTLLSEAQLVGLDFGQYDAVGDHTFGFSFDRSLLPETGGDFIAHLVAECLNDGLALIGHIPPVTRVDIPDPSQEAPEPALASGLLLLGGLGVLKRRTQQKADMA